MIIGINATAAIKQPRTGVEQYAYQLIKYLTMLPEATEHRFFLYLSAEVLKKNCFDFSLPENFIIKDLRWPLPFLWTQIRLAWEMLRRPPDVLFVPVHILPLIHPDNSIVVIHGLEYEYFPQYYSFLSRLYLRWSTKYAVRHGRKIIAVSENTKQDLIKLYGAEAEKIGVVRHGVEVRSEKLKGGCHNSKLKIEKPYLLYLGRTETKKNVAGILEAYKILKEKYQIPHLLILAGAPGFGYENLKLKIGHLIEIRNLALGIKELGYIGENEKQVLLANADIFLFPSFYEGFGLPVLEAQAAGVPVVTSSVSSLPEVAGEGALLVDPKSPPEIAKAVKRLIDDLVLRDKLIQSGLENVKRFSWEKCAKEMLDVLLS